VYPVNSVFLFTNYQNFINVFFSPLTFLEIIGMIQSQVSTLYYRVLT
jgi:hypothetical protein